MGFGPSCLMGFGPSCLMEFGSSFMWVELSVII